MLSDNHQGDPNRDYYVDARKLQQLLDEVETLSVPSDAQRARIHEHWRAMCERWGAEAARLVIRLYAPARLSKLNEILSGDS